MVNIKIIIETRNVARHGAVGYEVRDFAILRHSGVKQRNLLWRGRGGGGGYDGREGGR